MLRINRYAKMSLEKIFFIFLQKKLTCGYNEI